MLYRKRKLTKFGTQSGVLDRKNLKHVASVREALVGTGDNTKRLLQIALR